MSVYSYLVNAAIINNCQGHHDFLLMKDFMILITHFGDFVKLYTVCNVKWKMSREDKHYETDDFRIFLSKQPQISKGKGVRYRKTPFPLHVFTFYAHSKEWYCV